MPELPEVHTITQDLLENIVGYTIRKCDITKNYIALPNNDFFINSILGKKIINVERISKNILVHLENNSIIHFHLAMTGQILLKESTEISNKNWVKVILEIDKGTDTKFLFFSDMRMFGKIAIINEKDRNILLQKYGLEPIHEEITVDNFMKSIMSKRTPIKNALLDQKLVSGLGNIYATEALYLSGINPEMSTKNLTKPQATKLLEACKTVLLEGIEHRGSTLSDKKYVDIFGREGSHQNHFKIYSKSVCPICNTKVLNKKINGRSSYFCPVCQPIIKNENK